MTVEEYAAEQAAITAELTAQVLPLTSVFRGPTLTLSAWRQLLELLFPFVLAARLRAAELGRQFYDSQREQHHPNLPRHDAYLAEYRPEWFIEAMEPARQALSRPGAPDSAVAEVALRAMKEVENGGRRTILRAVDSDRVVQGWARVATGRETCAFCLTMISRGAVYLSAEGAGLNADDTTAQELWESGDEDALNELMTRWHAGCDCKVVPVFDRRNWPGRDEYLRALEVWKEYSRKVTNNPELRIPKNGNQRGPNDREWSKNEAILNAIRRALENGELDMLDFSAAA